MLNFPQARIANSSSTKAVSFSSARTTPFSSEGSQHQKHLGSIAFSCNHFTTAAFITRDFVGMKSSTKDKIKGGFEEAKGKVKEKAGKATGNPDLRDRGTAEKTGGKIQRKIGDIKKVFDQ